MEGQILCDRYRLIRPLGRGGMGSVWLAEHLTLKSQVAIKLIDSELAKLPEPRARFVREAQLAARIKAMHVVQMYDYGVTPEGQPFIAMEYLVGESLRERLDARSRLSCAETARIVSQTCRGLARAHEAGLVHRDLKPENVFLTRESDDEIAKVLDFGVAKATDALSDSSIDPTRTGALLGTPHYMSPEQAQGLKSVDSRTDLWAMGVVVFECLTGSRPFAGDALGPLIARVLGGVIPVPSVVAPDAKLPPEVDTWMLRALARDPAARFSSARELSDAFMVATGMIDSIDRATRAGEGNPASVWPSGPPPAREESLPLMATVSADVAPTLVAAPEALANRAPAPKASRLPWVFVAVLSAAVVVLGALLAMRH